MLLAVRAALPVPSRATELLDLTGRWCRERTPHRRSWQAGTHLREGRNGRTGHDATLVLAAGVPGFGFGHGEVWATHVAWSGDHQSYAERTPEGECVLGGGELLGPGEVELAPGRRYDAPWLVGTWSGTGLDAGLGPAARLAAAALAADPAHPSGAGEHLGGGLHGPPPRHPDRAGPGLGRGGGGAVRPRRRVVPRPAYRPGRARGLGGRPRRVAGGPAPPGRRR